MRKLIIFPGNSIQNKAWGEAALEHFQGRFDDAYLHYYRHWETGEGNIDFAHERDAFAAAIENDPTETGYIVFGKSVGSLLTLITVNDGVFDPEKAVFFGMPLKMAAEKVFADDWSALENFKVPAIAFHNDNDPTASFSAAKELLEAHNPAIQFVPTEGDDHVYDAFGEYEHTMETRLRI